MTTGVPGRNHFAEFRLANRNHTSRWRSQCRVFEIDAGKPEIFARRFDVCMGNCDFFRTASLPNLAQMLLGRLILCLRALKSSLRPVAILSGNGIATEEPLGAFEVQLSLLDFRSRIGNGLLSRFHVLWAAARGR